MHLNAQTNPLKDAFKYMLLTSFNINSIKYSIYSEKSVYSSVNFHRVNIHAKILIFLDEKFDSEKA